MFTNKNLFVYIFAYLYLHFSLFVYNFNVYLQKFFKILIPNVKISFCLQTMVYLFTFFFICFDWKKILENDVKFFEIL